MFWHPKSQAEDTPHHRFPTRSSDLNIIGNVREDEIKIFGYSMTNNIKIIAFQVILATYIIFTGKPWIFVLLPDLSS